MAEVTDARGVRIDYVVGIVDGEPVLVLHGAYSTRDELVPVLGPLLADLGMRAIHPDLPGMGASTPTTARTTADVVDALDALIDAEVGERPFAIVGHSFGAHLARGLVERRAAQVSGVALLAPYTPTFDPEPSRVVGDAGQSVDEEARGDFEGYFQVRTPETVERFERLVRPVLGRYDAAEVARIMEADTMSVGAGFDRPSLVLLGRDDAFIGWRMQYAELLPLFPRATLAVVSDAGHAVVHERPALVEAAIRDWVDRMRAAAGE